MNKQIDKKTPKISVVMAAYNRENYIKESIESILNQTYKDFEFIIVDDCSTDNTPNIIQGYADKDERIVFLKNSKNSNQIYSRNRALSIAKGKYIAILDDDDVALPNRLEVEASFLDRNPDITLVASDIETIGTNIGSWCKVYGSDLNALLLCFYCPLCASTIMYRKNFIEKHNIRYSFDARYCEDYELYLQIILLGGKIYNLKDILVQYRVHSNNETSRCHVQQTKQLKRHRQKLLEKIFNKKEAREVNDEIKNYPFFKANKRKTLYNLFSRMGQISNFFSKETVENAKKLVIEKPSKMHIFFSADDNYAIPLTVAITSILVNSVDEEKFNFYILDSGISNEKKARIETLKRIKDFNVEFIKVDDSLFNCCPITPECRHITKQTYYRYIIPWLKPELEKCFYFDCDIIINDSLSNFWNTDLKDNYVAVVEDLSLITKEDAKRLRVNSYFNAGVLLINNKLWQKDDITNLLLDNTKKIIDKIRWVDQDVLNYTFKDKVLFVSPIFNLQHSAFEESVKISEYTEQEIADAKSFPIIIHYSSAVKPWMKYCSHPFKNQYYKYLKFSPYKNEYYKYKFKKILTEFGRIFFYKKKSNDKTKIKILGIPVYKKINRDYLIKKYILGIKFYQKKDNFFSQIQDRFNYKLDCIEKAMDNSLKEISTSLIQEINKLKYELNNEVSKSLAVYNLHKKVFPKYKDVNCGKDVVIVATGPSFNDYIPINKAVHIGVNSACLQDKVNLDYLFVVDYKNIKSYIDTVINYRRNKCKKFCGIFMNSLDILNIPDCIAQKANAERYYLGYNQLHYNENFYPDITTSPLPSFWSVTFQAIAFALWTNPKKLYLVGCDHTFNGHFDNTEQNWQTEENKNQHVIKHNDGWKKMKEFASIYYPETEIISINPVGLKGVFKDLYTGNRGGM